MKTTILVEGIELVEGTLNREARTVDVVLIRPGWSANGRYYSKDVLAKAAPLFEGAKAYANHPTREQLKRGEGRSVLDITGDYTNVRVGPGGELLAQRAVYGQAGAAVWPLIERQIELKPEKPIIGISINALGKAVEGEQTGRKGVVVESIDIVNSADDVDKPAAGGGFERLIADNGSTLIADLLKMATYEEITEARPDVVESVKKQNKRVRLDEETRALVEERDSAKTELEQLSVRHQLLTEQLKEARAHNARLLREIQLKAALDSIGFDKDYAKLLRQQMESTPPDQWLTLLKLEKEKLRLRNENAPVQVRGVPLRESVRMTAKPIDDGPIDPTDLTPEELVAEIQRRKQAKRSG